MTNDDVKRGINLVSQNIQRQLIFETTYKPLKNFKEVLNSHIKFKQIGKRKKLIAYINYYFTYWASTVVS